MNAPTWRKTPLRQALAGPELQAHLRSALQALPLCDHCLGRLVAQVDTGLGNEERGRIVRETLAGPPAPDLCGLCHGLFADFDPWVEKARRAAEGWGFRTLAVSSHANPRIVEAEEALWHLTGLGPQLAEPYKQAFNRALGSRLCEALGREADLRDPDLSSWPTIGSVTSRCAWSRSLPPADTGNWCAACRSAAGRSGPRAFRRSWATP
jgi:hypothetical protein